MRAQSWNTGWTFTDRPLYPGAAGRDVTLPHDAAIASDVRPDAPAGRASGYYPGGMAIYTRLFDAPASWQGQRVMVAFDGVYGTTDVCLNGHWLACHHYGYTPFAVDLTPYLYFHRPNRLEVTANNTAQPNSRWYTGTGIYRPVSLLVGPPVHIAPWGIFAHTDTLENDCARVTAEVTVVNQSGRDTDQRVTATLEDGEGRRLAEGFVMLHIPAGEQTTARVPLSVPDAPLWDVDNPRLCTVRAVCGGDEAATRFGIRTLRVDRTGFWLNGRSLKLKGGCVHHDNGIVGAAAFADSEYRKMKLHKDNGYNAIRTAHNPPSTHMLDACDRLGLLVLDEAFDMWRMGKSANDYHLYFDSDWRADMEAFMRRDRNHPCVVLWSTGNEIGERAGLSGGYELARQLAEHMRAIDPTRPVTNALCSFWNGLDDEMTEQRLHSLKTRLIEQNGGADFDDLHYAALTEPFAAPLDVAGYNYLDERYAADGAQFPQRVICGTESYPMQIDVIWDRVMQHDYVLGDFTWTSFDYIGEAGIGKTFFREPGSDNGNPAFAHFSAYPWRLAYDADFDICGYPRPQLAYRRIVWGSDETFIAVHDPAGNGKEEVISDWGWPQVCSHWTWPGCEGEPLRVAVYSAADEVALYCNGTLCSRAPAGKAARYTAHFTLPYAPGTLEAVSLTNGQEVSRQRLVTAGAPAALRITFEPGTFAAGEQSLAYATVEVVDACGRRVPGVDLPARADVSGAASLLAFGSARPATEENYTAGRFTSFNGCWQAVLRSGAVPGSAVLRVEAEGLPPAEAAIDVL